MEAEKAESSVSSAGRDVVLAKMDPMLIHRVMLTDQSKFCFLTTSGKPPAMTPSYEDFFQHLESSSSTKNVDRIMKKAFRDHVCTFVLNTRNMEPVHQLLLELHTKLRSLVPNRKDLHGILKDENVRLATNPSEILPLVLEAGQSLEQLESEARSESTNAWITESEKYDISSDAKESVYFIVTSIMYLLHKAELCKNDKQDFYLANVWAPELHAGTRGIELERIAFETRFGSLSNKSTAPHTQKWIQTLVGEQSDDNRSVLRVSSEARMNLIRVGWVEDILFRSAERPSLLLPEVLALDNLTIEGIREVTRIAAVGSALALHACNTAGVSSTVLNQPLEQSSPVEARRGSLVQAMADRNWSSQVEYEESVSTAVFALAKEWNSSLDDKIRETLASRTSCVLRGEDPVIKLLSSRMKVAFQKLVVWKPQAFPLELRSGRGNLEVNQGGTEPAKLFEAEAKKEFCTQGLSFYASDLAAASAMAVKVIELAWNIYGNNFLDKLVLEACRESTDEQ